MRPLEVFVAPRGNAFMRDIASWLVEAGELLGRASRLRDDGGAPSDERAVNLVVAPHEFFLLCDLDDRQIDDAVRISVPVCTEQPGTPWFEIAALVARNSPAVLDINAHGATAFSELDIAAEHLRLGAVPSIDHRRTVAQRDLELLFLGGRTSRRAAELAPLARVLWNRSHELRLFTFSRPVDDDVPGLVFGAAKYDLLARSRLLLNIHRDDQSPGYFEWARMIEAMANGCCVVTEPSTGHLPLEAGVHFIEADDLSDAVETLLDDPDLADEIGERAAAAVLDEYPLTASLGPLLDRLDEVSPSARRRVRPKYRTSFTRAQRGPLLPVFAPTTEIRQRIYHALTAETLLLRDIERVRCLVEHGVDDHVERIESAGYSNAQPEVSVVVTLYNYADLVGETLDSIAGSTDVDPEIVIVDDHSTDDGRAMVRSFVARRPDVPVLLLASDINRGLPAARNLGFQHARSELIMVMDADNLVYPNALRTLADALGDDDGAVMAYSTLEEFGTDSGIRSAMAWYPPWLCERNYIDAQAMIRRSAWERHGGYRTDDELVFGWEDWELWLRFAAAGERGVHVPRMLGRYRTQSASMISTSNLVADHMRRHLRELHPSLPWPAA